MNSIPTMVVPPADGDHTIEVAYSFSTDSEGYLYKRETKLPSRIARWCACPSPMSRSGRGTGLRTSLSGPVVGLWTACGSLAELGFSRWRTGQFRPSKSGSDHATEGSERV